MIGSKSIMFVPIRPSKRDQDEGELVEWKWYVNVMVNISKVGCGRFDNPFSCFAKKRSRTKEFHPEKYQIR